MDLRKHRAALVLTGFVMIGLLVWSCSDSSVYEVRSPSISFEMSLSSSELLEAVVSFQVIVTSPDFDTIIAPLVLVDGRYLVGDVDVPIGSDRKFTVQAMDEAGTVIYEGSIITNVPPTTGILNVPMRPVVKMVNVSPRYRTLLPDRKTVADVKVFGIDSLYSISLRVRLHGYVVGYDSGYLHPTMDPNLIYSDTLGFDNISLFYAVYVSQIDGLTPIVDAAGDASIVRLILQTYFPEIGVDSTMIAIEVTGLYQFVNGDPSPVPFTDVYTDGGTYVVGESITPDSIVQFADPNLEAIIRQEINKPTGDIFLSDVAPIDTLFAGEANISDLTGLSNLSNLDLLQLDYNIDIVDISELASLPGLTALFLEGNSISDIGPLTQLVNLRLLSLSYNNIADIQPLLANAQLGGIGVNDVVFLIGNPVDTTQVNALCTAGPAIFLVDAQNDWCAGLK